MPHEAAEAICCTELGLCHGHPARVASKNVLPLKTETRATLPVSTRFLFSQSKPSDDLLVSRSILSRQILQQAVALPNHLQQPATRGMILLVRLEVLGQFGNASGQKSDLNFRRAGVLLVSLVIADDLVLILNSQSHLGHSR